MPQQYVQFIVEAGWLLMKCKLMTLRASKTGGYAYTRKQSTLMKHQEETFRRNKKSHLKYQHINNLSSGVVHLEKQKLRHSSMVSFGININSINIFFEKNHSPSKTVTMKTYPLGKISINRKKIADIQKLSCSSDYVEF